jgi:hypothetical protein
MLVVFDNRLLSMGLFKEILGVNFKNLNNINRPFGSQLNYIKDYRWYYSLVMKLANSNKKIGLSPVLHVNL